LVDFHRTMNAVTTLTVFRAEHPSACGIVELDGHGRLIKFIEKPPKPSGNLANAGIYALHPRVLYELSGPTPIDIGYDLLPLLVGRARALLIDGYFRDIGTPIDYQLAQDDWPHNTLP
jgi:mannose-1-phosphate guanylyltransferase